MKRISKDYRRNSSAQLESEPPLDVRITLLGSGGVGKSALAVRFLCRRFLGEYDPTLEDTYLKMMVLNGKLVNMSILDTAGEDPDNLLRQQQCSSADAVMVVFSLADRTTFREARRHLEMVSRSRHARMDGSYPLIGSACLLVGNKTDLRRYREIGYDEGSQLAAEFGVRYAETSASDDRPSVDRAFLTVVDVVRCQRRASPSGIFSGSHRSRRGSSGVFDSQLVSLRDRLSRSVPVGAH